MKFSVLINNYNYARYLPETIASVCAQTHPPHEIIVVDDGSKDDSLAVLESLRATTPGLRIHAKPNGGQLSAFRQGIDLATGDWCAFLDSDDMWEKDHLAQAASILAREEHVECYYSGHRTVPEHEIYASKWPPGRLGPLQYLVSVTGMRIGTITSALVFRKDILSAIMSLPAGFDQEWRTRADDCLVFGAALSGARFWFNHRPTVIYRIHGQNAYAQRPLPEESNSLYLERRKRLFTFYCERFGLAASPSGVDIIRELRQPNNRCHAVVRRRARRAIARLPLPRSQRLLAWLSAWF